MTQRRSLCSTPGLCACVPAAGAVPGLPHGGRQCPVRGRLLGLPGGARPGGSCAETPAGGAPAPASGVPCFPCPELGCPGCRMLGKVFFLCWGGRGTVRGSTPFPEGAGMWSWEQTGLPWLWCVPVPHCCCCFWAGRALQGELRNKERFLLPPEHPWLFLGVLSVPKK